MGRRFVTPSEGAIGLAAVLGLALLAYRLRALDARGAVAGVLIGAVVTLTGGLTWFAVVVVFFALSGLFTRYRYEWKARSGVAQDRGGARGWPNAVANGGLAAAIAAGEYVARVSGFPGDLLALAFVGAVATSTADTLATELGLLSRVRPRLISGFQEVSPGTSGGLTFLGQAGALLGALAISGAAWLLGVLTMPLLAALLSIGVAGMVGTLLDSVLGATAQGTYICTVCGLETESRRHHGQRAKRVRGLRLLDNNGVNLVATGCGALVALLMSIVVLPAA